jgi:hypothetical protein
MSGKHANRINGDDWRQQRKPIERGSKVRNRRKSMLSGKRHYRDS